MYTKKCTLDLKINNLEEETQLHPPSMLQVMILPELHMEVLGYIGMTKVINHN